MSGYIRREDRLFDPTTGALVGYIDANGNEQLGGAVSGAGIPVGLSPALIAGRAITGQLPNGMFIGMLGDSSHVSYAAAYDASPVQILSSRSYVAGNILDTLGNQITAMSWVNAWPCSNGDIVAYGTCSGAQGAGVTTGASYLFRMKQNTNAVGSVNSMGSDANYSNKQAILDLGRIGGTQGPAGIRALTSRSFLEATILGAKVYLFAEYNVASGRVSGSTNDQVRLWKSTDLGATWTALLTFNTSGHQVSHIHSVVQDPYSKWIYVMFGDIGAENGVLAWDGVSAAPAANTALASFSATPGWRVVSGSELNRFTDLCFGPLGLYTIPDADSETFDTTTTAFVGVTVPRTLDYVASHSPVARVAAIPPIINYRDVNNKWGMVSSFFTTGAAESYIHFWLQDDANGLLPWRLSNKIKLYSSGTGYPLNLFMGTDGYLYMASSSTAGLYFNSAQSARSTLRIAVTGPSSSTAVFDAG